VLNEIPLPSCLLSSTITLPWSRLSRTHREREIIRVLKLVISRTVQSSRIITNRMHYRTRRSMLRRVSAKSKLTNLAVLPFLLSMSASSSPLLSAPLQTRLYFCPRLRIMTPPPAFLTPSKSHRDPKSVLRVSAGHSVKCG
jgi:hypothetical protein